jgi:hypothetical protein
MLILLIPRRLPNTSKETQEKCTTLKGAHHWRRGWSINIGHCEHKSLSLQTVLLEARAVLNGHLQQSRSNDRINKISFISLLCLPHAKKEVVYWYAHYLRLDLSFTSLHFYILGGGKNFPLVEHERCSSLQWHWIPQKPETVLQILQAVFQNNKECCKRLFKFWHILNTWIYFTLKIDETEQVDIAVTF